MLTTPGSLVGLVLSAALSAVLLTGCGGGDGQPGARPSTAAGAADSVAPSTATATLVRTDVTQLQQGDAVAASTTFGNVLAIDPHNVSALYNLGLIAQQAGQDARAVQEYDAALATDRAYAPALYNRGILTESTDLPAAVGLYQRAVAADPTFAQAYMRLGFALVHLGRRDEGAAALGKGVSLDPAMASVQAPRYRS